MHTTRDTLCTYPHMTSYQPHLCLSYHTHIMTDHTCTPHTTHTTCMHQISNCYIHARHTTHTCLIHTAQCTLNTQCTCAQAHMQFTHKCTCVECSGNAVLHTHIPKARASVSCLQDGDVHSCSQPVKKCLEGTDKLFLRPAVMSIQGGVCWLLRCAANKAS